MSKYTIVHYINNFFAGIGGEEKANIPPKIRPGAVGPGIALQGALGEDFEIVATVICGDSYFGENIDAATRAIIEMISSYQPSLFVAGPAFNAGRYGVACGTIAKAVAERLQIPVITGMFEENPGVDMFRKDLYIVKTGNSAANMRNTLPKLAALAKKLVLKAEILGPQEEGYHERGIRVNYFHNMRGSARAVEMLVRKIAKQPFETEYPMAAFDRVIPAAHVADITKAKIALITSGGVVPQGNPDHIESSSATRYGTYSISGLDAMTKEKFMTIHGGYDRAFANENPNLVVPLDVMRDLEREGAIGELANYYMVTTGTGTSTSNAKGFGKDIAQRLLQDNISAVILTST